MADETLTDLTGLFEVCLKRMEEGNPAEVLQVEDQVLRRFAEFAGILINNTVGERHEYAGQLGFLAGMITGIELTHLRNGVT